MKIFKNQWLYILLSLAIFWAVTIRFVVKKFVIKKQATVTEMNEKSNKTKHKLNKKIFLYKDAPIKKKA